MNAVKCLTVVVALLQTSLAANPISSTIFTLLDCDDRDIDTLLTGARGLMENTINQINELRTASILTPLTGDGRLANNARSLFGTQAPWWRSLSSADKATLLTVSDNYNTVSDALNSGTNIPQASSYILCDDSKLEYTTDITKLGPIPGPADEVQARYGSGVWYYPGVVDANGVARIIFTGLPSQPNLCAQTAPGETRPAGAWTFTPHTPLQANAPDNDVKKILLCPLLFDPTQIQHQSLSGLLGANMGKNSNPDDHKTAPGIFAHEMFHFLDPPTWHDKGWNFVECWDLAHPDTDSDTYTNPDTMRIFAEMCYMSGTRWMAAPQS